MTTLKFIKQSLLNLLQIFSFLKFVLSDEITVRHRKLHVYVWQLKLGVVCIIMLFIFITV